MGMAGIFGAYGLSELRAYLLPKAPAIMVTFRAARIRVPAGPPYEYQWKHISQYLLLAAILVAWPWFTFLGLMIFQISMRQAKVRPIHVLRGVLYASSVVFWAGLVSLAWYAGRAAMMSAMGVNSIRFHRYDALLFMIPTEIAFTACLEVAFSRYLRFPHALATILSAQIIVALTVAAAILFAQNITNWPP
ncbi:MAG TPA: hypothetical protein VFC78_04035 [Tepidisphaeraceae bacterium]|nr:hypothetical protein [Tepidisphaeraceae bacterium]